MDGGCKEVGCLTAAGIARGGTEGGGKGFSHGRYVRGNAVAIAVGAVAVGYSSTYAFQSVIIGKLGRMDYMYGRI